MTELHTAAQPKRSQIANYILAAAAIILLLAYPFQDFFWGGLLTHLAGAALIGGLADWYAVTALFRRPLGISFKTALIPNSKERIAEMARHMIESEILTVPNMYNVLKHHPILSVGGTRIWANPQYVFIYRRYENRRQGLFRRRRPGY